MYPPPPSNSPPQLPPQDPHGYYSAVHPLDILLAPARRAAMLMFIIAALSLVLGGCTLLASSVITNEELSTNPDFQQAMREMKVGAKGFRILLVVIATIAMLLALSFSVVAFFVRKGSIGSLITGIVVTVVPLLVSLLLSVASLVMGRPLEFLVYGAFGGAMVTQLVWLSQAAARAGQVGQWRQYLSATHAMSSYGYAAQQHAHQYQLPLPPPTTPQQTNGVPPNSPPPGNLPPNLPPSQ